MPGAIDGNCSFAQSTDNKVRQMKPCSVLTILLFCVAGRSTCAQTTYDTFVQQGKAQLQSSNNDAALSSGQQAIQLDPNRCR